jgi:hypothetical protein
MVSERVMILWANPFFASALHTRGEINRWSLSRAAPQFNGGSYWSNCHRHSHIIVQHNWSLFYVLVMSLQPPEGATGFFFIPNHWLGLRRLIDPSTSPEDEVIVACLPYCNIDVCGQAIFIGVIAYLGDDTIYDWSSSWHYWWSESASSTTISRTPSHSRCCRWEEVGYALYDLSTTSP